MKYETELSGDILASWNMVRSLVKQTIKETGSRFIGFER